MTEAAQTGWLDAIPAAIFVVQERHVSFANAAAADLIGCPQDDLAGMDVELLVEDVSLLDAGRGDTSLKLGADRTISVELTSAEIEFRGEPARLVTALQRPPPDPYRAAVEGSADGFFVMEAKRDADHRIIELIVVDASAQGLRQTGLSRAQLIGRTIRDLYPAHSASQLLNGFARRTAPGAPLVQEVFVAESLVKDGWYQFQLIPLENDRFAVFLRSVVERKESRNVVQRLAGEIEQQARLLDEVLSTTPDGFILFDRAGRYLYVNRAGLANAGLNAEQVIGKTWRELGFPEEAGLTFERRLDYVFTTGESITYEEQFPTVTGLREFLTTQTPIHDQDGNVILLLNTIRDITGRKQAELEQQKLSAELEQQARVLDEVLSTTPDNFLMFDRAGKFVYASPSALRNVGLTAEQVVGTTWSELGFPDEVGKRTNELMERVFTTGESTVIEVVFPTVGGLRNFESIFSPLHDKEGRVVDVIITSRDITERKQIEEALGENQRLLTSIFNTAVVGIAVIDERGYYVQANRTYGSIYGFTPAEMIGQHMTAVWSPNMHEAALEVHNRLMRGEITTSVTEWTVRRKDQDVEISAYNSLLIRENGERFRVVVSIDVSEQKRAQRALEASEQRLTSILDSMQDAVWSVQAETHHLVYANAAIELLTGFSSARFTADPHLLIDIVHPEDRERFADQLRQVLVDGERIDTEYRIVRRDGATCWVHNRFWVVTGMGGQRIDGIMTDITDRRQTSEQAMQLAMERERVRILSDFVRDASHEFRTPLSVINTRLYLMEKIGDPERQVEFIEGIREQAERILKLVESLITMSRLDSLAKIQFERIDLNRVLTVMNITTEAAARRKQLNFTLELAPEALYVQGEMNELMAAFNAIFENARTFTPPGGHVDVRTYRRSDHEVVVEVRDSGVGISSAELPHIFERFYRVDRARSIRGFGLGLPIARKIVEMHHGHVEVESVFAQGSVFRLVFPADSHPSSPHGL